MLSIFFPRFTSLYIVKTEESVVDTLETGGGGTVDNDLWRSILATVFVGGVLVLVCLVAYVVFDFVRTRRQQQPLLDEAGNVVTIDHAANLIQLGHFAPGNGITGARLNALNRAADYAVAFINRVTGGQQQQPPAQPPAPAPAPAPAAPAAPVAPAPTMVTVSVPTGTAVDVQYH